MDKKPEGQNKAPSFEKKFDKKPRPAGKMGDRPARSFDKKDGKPFGNHYGAVIPKGKTGSPFQCGDEFYFYLNHNGTDVVAWDGKLEKKEIK